MSNRKAKAYPALFVLLAFGIFLNIFPILAVIPASESEIHLMSVIEGMRASGINGLWETINGGNIVENSYALITMLLMDFVGRPESLFLLRFPTAIITAILTLCLFRFDRTSETLGNSFIAALVFMGCSYVETMCIMAHPAMISAVFIILSLVSLYHWIRLPHLRNTILMITTSAVATFTTGTLSLILIMVLGTACMLVSGGQKRLQILYLFLSLVSTALIIFAVLYAVTGDVSVPQSLLFNFTSLEAIEEEYNSNLIIFLYYILMTIFPWSVLMLFSLPWAVKNWSKVYENILGLSRLQKFGIYVFVVSLPLFFVYSQYSNALMLASAFFNAPAVGKILTWQFNHNPNAWRITGGICSVFSGILIILFLLWNNGVEVLGFSFTRTYWSPWNVILVVAIFFSIYSLSRNWREVYRNHRFFFNLIILYLLMQNLTIGYILPGISF